MLCVVSKDNSDLCVYSRRSQFSSNTAYPYQAAPGVLISALPETWRKVIVSHVSVIWLIDLVYIPRFHIEVHIITAILLITK